ncbi:MAG: LruC domain-containing protein [Candidatus Cloacimonetes bacterium]|nr:LruC domain-containing protein [Candidatus Cloacimonadota bacterium]
MRIMTIFMILALLFMSSCSKTDDPTEFVTDLEIPEDFEFDTGERVRVDISLQTNQGESIPGVVYNLSYVDINGEYQYIRSNMTNTAGVLNTILDLPAYVEKVFVSGFMNSMELEIVNNEVEYEFQTTTREYIDEIVVPTPSRSFTLLDGITYDSYGAPNPNSYDMYPVTPEMLLNVDTSLPESVSLPNSHPQYLEDGITTNFIISDSSDVWVTFITEGAGYMNALGFYTYDQAEGAPENPEELEHILLFPNASLWGSGGRLNSGMQLYIGRFGAGTVMGWFLVQNGWIYGTNVSETAERFYSDRQYNPEPEEYNQHQVLLYDAESELFLLGFDDQVRPGGDNDFNDAVFFVTANPIEYIDTSQIPPIDIPVDTDEDGVNDPFDEYPDDPERAFDVYYPSSTQTATLVFEDKWPQYGDYDLNDMVLDYRYKIVTNADDEVKDLSMEYSLRAAGAFFNNGFSLQVPFEFANLAIADSSDNISPVLVQDNNYSIIDFFSSTSSLTGLAAGTFFNTEEDQPYYEPVVFTAKITLTSPVDLESLPFSFPFNPFIRRQGDHDHEIHLMNYAPTSRHDTDLFMTEDDNSDPNTGSYYVSPVNLPWGLNLAESWQYPKERSSITEAYLQFADWAESGGDLNEDWFIYSEDRVDPGKIYQTP